MNIEQGSLKETPAAALLLEIFEESRSGVLYLKRDEILKELYIDRGKLVWAASNSEVDTLENMITTKKKVEKQTIDLVKKDLKNEIELGKILVEKGLISLDELIEFSKVQMRKIVKSILKWSDGVYYFSKDVPANTFINLEIDLRRFVYDFVKLDLDMGFIWKGIGSFQEIFIKSENNKKIEIYNLLKPELELLDKFTGEVNVEVISLNFVGLPKEDILKIIYFFLLSGLLSKKDEVEKEDDRLAIPESLISGPKKNDIVIDSDLEKTDQIELDEIDNQANQFFEKTINKNEKKVLTTEKTNVKDDPGDIDKDISMTDKMLMDLNIEKSKKKNKLLNIFLLLILVTLIISGGIFLLLNNGKSNENKLMPKISLSKKTDEKKSNGIKKTENREKKKSPDKNISLESKKQLSGKSVIEKKENPGKTLLNSEKNTKEKSIKVSSSDSLGRSAFSYFKKGDFISAGNLWRKEILNSYFKFSILLELDCVKESVKYAHKKITDKSKFFLLNYKRMRKNCYLVLYGKYMTAKEAADRISFLPGYFLKQSNPPRVLELSKYL